jgi:hypothetical protein
VGGRAGLGGEDGRACGGAVSFFVRGRRTRAGLVFVLMMNFSIAACSRQSAPLPPDAATVLQAIAAADPAKYPSLQETKHWSNPYLVIRPDAVGLITGVAANEEQILKPEEVLHALVRLPKSAWPYGRTVAILVDEKATASEQDKIAIRRSRGIVAGDLQGAQVAINWIPTS